MVNFQTWIRELGAFLGGPAKKKWKDVENVDPTRPTIFLVSGFAAPRRRLSVIRRRLKREGFNVVVFALDWKELGDAVKGLSGISQRLRGKVDQLREIYQESGQFQDIFLVTHSIGGLVARDYLQNLGGFRYCKGLVTLACPHLGTWVAALGFFSHLILKFRFLIEMLPGSQFIRRLNQMPFPEEIQWLNLYSNRDPICPPKSAELPPRWRASSSIHSFCLLRHTHSDFLMSKACFQNVNSFLQQVSLRKVG